MDFRMIESFFDFEQGQREKGIRKIQNGLRKIEKETKGNGKKREKVEKEVEKTKREREKNEIKLRVQKREKRIN